MTEPPAGTAPASRTLPRQAYLDSIRGIACLLVVFHHLDINAGIRPVTIWGFTGVHVFFVLSGYLLCRPYLKALAGNRPFPPIFSFYTRRFIRIYPPYFIALLVYLALRYVTHSHTPAPTDIALHLALLFNYGTPGYFFTINPAFWSLAIEAQFYIALPLLAGGVYLLTRNRSAHWRILSFVIVLYVVGIFSRSIEFLLMHSTMPPYAGEVLYFRTLPSYLDLFGAGVLVAVLESIPIYAEKLRQKHILRALFSTGLFLFLLSNIWCSVTGFGAWLTVNNFGFSIAFPVLLCLSIAMMMTPIVLDWGEHIRWLNARPFVALGAISYSVYLYHIGIQFFILKTIHLDHYVSDYGFRNFVYSLISFLPVIGISALMYWLVERPCLNYLSNPRHDQRASVGLQTTPVLPLVGTIKEQVK